MRPLRSTAGVLPAYFRRRIGLQIAAVLAILMALMQLFELLDITTEVLQRGLGVPGLVRYALLRLPSELALALPLAVLLGTATALHAMARQLEITAARTVGVTLTRILLYLMPLVVVLGLLQFGLSERVLPWSEAALKQWWNATAPPADARQALWVHTDGGPLSIAAAGADGRSLRGVRLYERAADGGLQARVYASEARWDGQAWQLIDVLDIRIGNGGGLQVARTATRAWQTNLRPDEVLRLDSSRPQLSSIVLADVMAGTRVRTQPLSVYRTLYYRSFTKPFGVFVQVLLALPTACWLVRHGGNSRDLLVTIVLGLSFLLTDGIAAALGSGGRLPPLLPAVAAPLLFTAVGLLRLRRCQRA